MVPPEVVAALEGTPLPGTIEPMFPFITSDAEGFPHVCLLSRTELMADGTQVLAYLRASVSAENLRQRPRATLVVVISDAAYYCKLQLELLAEFEGSIGCSLRVVSVQRDSIGVSLYPPCFFVDEDLATAERWTHAASVLNNLRPPQ